MFNLTDMLLPPDGEAKYASKMLQSKGFNGTPTSAGPLAFGLSEGREQNRQAALGGMSNSMGEIIKLLVYLKGIGAFKGSAFKNTKPQANQNSPFMATQPESGYAEPSSFYQNEDALMSLIQKMHRPSY